VSNATQKSLNATTSYSQSYVVFNNTIPAFANRDVNFAVDDVIFTNKTANASGFLSFNYTNYTVAGSTHNFKWVLNVPGYDIDQNGFVNILDLNYIGQHYGEVTSSPYPAYDVDQNGVVDSEDMLIVVLHFGDITG
jgi:hypothetical protein